MSLAGHVHPGHLTGLLRAGAAERAGDRAGSADA